MRKLLVSAAAFAIAVASLWMAAPMPLKAKVVIGLSERLPLVANNTDLQTRSVSSFSPAVMRMTHTTGMDPTPLVYAGSNSACSLNGGNGDGGSQVKSWDGKCWLAVVGTEGLDIRQFGGGPAVADNSAALQSGITWARTAKNNLRLPGGTLNFATPPTCGAADNWGIVGAGSQVTTLNYNGASTTVDIISCGDAVTVSNQVAFVGFRLASSTTMTAGTGLRLKNMVKPRVRDFVGDGEYGNGKLWHALWFDRIVNGAELLSYDLRGQCDGLRVNNGADLYMGGNGRIRLSAGAATTCAGLHVGGGFGGLECVSGDIIQNARNILVDTALTAVTNREIFVHSGCLADTASVDDNIQLNDTLASANTFELHGYISGAARDGINIIAWPNSTVSVHGKMFLNGRDGVRIADATTQVRFGPNADVRGNAGTGINCTVANTIIGNPVPKQNTTAQIATACVSEVFSGYASGLSLVAQNPAPQLYSSGALAGELLYTVSNTSASTSASAALSASLSNTANLHLKVLATAGGGTAFTKLESGAGATGGLLLSAAAGPVAVEGPFKLQTKTVATLGTCDVTNAGRAYWVSDALSPAWNATLAQGGTAQVLGVCNGVNWTAH